MAAQDSENLYSLPYDRLPTYSDYDSLINKPKLNGYTVEGEKTAEDYDIIVPTKVSDLPNDAHYATESQIPTQLSQLANNVGFTTQAYVDDKISRVRDDIPTKTSDLTNDSGFITNTVNDLTNYTLTSALSTVATSGSYNDLSNKPEIPIVYDTNSTTFTITIPHSTSGNIKSALVFSQSWAGVVSIGNSSQIWSFTIGNLSNVTMTPTIAEHTSSYVKVTLTFSTTIYGGIKVLV